MITIGYTLGGQDNDTYMFPDSEYKSGCPACGYRINCNEINPSYSPPKKRNWDFSYTYDGYAIVSLRFKEFCKRAGYSGIEFRGFQTTKDFYFISVTKQLPFDFERRGTRFLKQCKECGRYDSVVGATPAYFKCGKLSDGFYRSDLEFASGNEKSPLLAVGLDTRKRLEKEGLTGLEFKEAQGKA